MTSRKTLSKRGLALVLALTMCLSLFSTAAFADDENEQGKPAPEVEVVETVGDGDEANAEPEGTEETEDAEKPEADEGAEDGEKSEDAEEAEGGEKSEETEKTEGNEETEKSVGAEETEDDEKSDATEGVKKEEAPTYATLAELDAAFEAVGEADDVTAFIAAMDAYLDVYSRLSPEDQEARAEEMAYVQSYRDEVAAGNPDEEIELLAMTCEQKGSVCYAYVGVIYVDENGIQKDYSWHRKTQFTCYGTNGHAYNANHTFKWSELNAVGAKYFTRQSPGVNGQQKISYSPVPSGTITTQNDQVFNFVFVQPTTYTVTVNYVFEGGGKAATSKSITDVKNTSYSWTSPTISGYTPDKAVVSGKISGNETITVTYKSNVQKVTLTYDANGGSNAPAAQTVDKGGDVTIKNKQSMTRDGHTFLGWSTDPKATAKDSYWSDYGSVVPLNADTTLYAVWTPSTYTITYTDGVSDKEVFADQNKTAKYGEATPAFTGDTSTLTYTDSTGTYEFTGWAPEVKNTVDGSQTYTAQWTQKQTDKPELSVVKKADKDVVKVGDTVVYTITVTNSGKTDATNVIVTDTLPKELDWVTDDAAEYQAGKLTWTIPEVKANGGTASVSFTAKVTQSGKISNTATAAIPADPDTSATSAPEVITGVEVAIKTTKKHNEITVDNGVATIPYVVTVTNNKDDLFGLDIIDKLTKVDITDTSGNAVSDEVKNAVQIAYTDVTVDGEPVSATMTAENGGTVPAISRSSKFAEGQTVTLTYNITVKNTSTEAVVVSLSNTATGGSWITDDNGARSFLAPRDGGDDGYDITDEDTDSASVGSNTSVVIPPAAKVTITYKDGDTVLDTDTPNKGDEYEVKGLPESVTPPEGKEFDKWQGSDGKEYHPSDKIIADNDLTLTAVWKDKTPPVVTKPALTGIKKELAGDAPASVKQGESVTLRYKITVTGDEGAAYIVSDPDATPETVKGILDGSGKTEIYVTKTVTANEAGTLNVTNTAYVKPDGDGIDPIKPADPENDPTDPEKGYPSEPVETSVTVTAPEKPDEPEKKTVTWYDGKGDDGKGTVVETKDLSEDGTVPEAPAAPEAPEGKVFDGWSEPVTGEDGNITIIAKWKDAPKDPDNPAPEQITASWLPGYGDNTPIQTKEYDKGTTAVPADDNPANPTRTGYTFTGWSAPVIDADGNIAITAQWRRSGGGSGTGGGGGGGTTPTTPTGPADPAEVEIDDPDVPLAAAPGLNSTDHFAYIIGYPDGTVRPTGNITRAEVATIFFRLMTDDYRSANWSTTSSFSDVQAGRVWYSNAVATTEKAGLIKGYADGTFGGDRSITRAEFATIAARFLSNEEVTENPFDDIAGHWAEQNILRAVQAGWIRGDGNGKFRPDDQITRAEVMTLVNRMLDRVPDKEHMLSEMIVWPDNPDSAWYYEAVQEATNGHDYERADGAAETWTALQPVRDWAALETEWAANGGASAPTENKDEG